MKIHQDYRIIPEKMPGDGKGPAIPAGSNFKALVSEQLELQNSGQLKEILAEIEKAGDRLEKSRNFRDLFKYKSLIKKYIHDAVHMAMKIKRTEIWGPAGNHRLLSRVEVIDQKLMALTNELLKKEQDQIRILELLGEIKGLLINLYT
jgi:Protein of unknown function (DUF327).